MFRRFYLARSEDVSGVSGTGYVAQGCVFDNNSCILTWLGPLTSVAIYRNVDEMIQIHGHEGRTIVEWVDYPKPALAEAA